MDLRPFENMEAADLKKYVQFLLHNYRVVDAFWFLYTAEGFGQPAAERINERVWRRLGSLAARDIVKIFPPQEKGLKGFVRTLRLFPWTILIGYDIEESEHEIVLTVPSCPVQVARIKRGLGEFVCRDMHHGEFESFAKVVDERIEVQCLFAPPDAHPADAFCKWRFFLREGG